MFIARSWKQLHSQVQVLQLIVMPYVISDKQQHLATIIIVYSQHAYRINKEFYQMDIPLA